MTAAEFERLARVHRPALLALARRRVATYEDAEDIVQQALANAFEVRERIRAPTGLPYLRAIARNEALRHGRHVKPLSLDQPMPGTDTASVYEILADPRRRDVDGELDVLAGLRAAKPDHARALIARMLGWRYREICDAFGWTYTKTDRCLKEGRAALRAATGA